MTLDVRANESGVVRIFALSMEDEKAQALKANSGIGGTGGGSSLKELALGAAALDPEHVEVFPIDDLGEMALPDYLVEGAGAKATEIDADRFKLSSLEGWVMIVYSSAFRGVAQSLSPSSQLTLIGSYGQEGTEWSAPVDLSTASALPQETETPAPKKRPSDAAMSGRIAMLALLVAFFVVGLMLWVGG